MRTNFFRLFLSILFLLSVHSLFAQFGPGRPGGANGGLFSVASPASSGRVVTVGGRLEPVRKITHTVPVAGTVDMVFVRVGQRVTLGQELVQIRRDAVGETYPPPGCRIPA